MKFVFEMARHSSQISFDPGQIILEFAFTQNIIFRMNHGRKIL